MNQCRKKVIPWHVQQRYMESFNQLSLNQTQSAAMYKRKIKSLQRNNKHLALALQRSRYHATDKENLLIDNGKILDIVNFSRIKLMDMAIIMKQATEYLDETLLLLNSSLTDTLSKHSPSNRNYRNDLKNKIQEISKNPPIEEMSECSDSSDKKVQSHARKGKISRVDGCVSSPNKKCKLTKKGRPIKTDCKKLSKSPEESSSATSATSSKNTRVKNSKNCGSTLNDKSQNRRKSSPKYSTRESASSSKLSMSTSSSRFLQAKAKQESLNKKRKAVKVILTDIAESFLTQETENYQSPVKDGPTSASHSTNPKCCTSNSPEDDILIKKYFSSELKYNQKSSVSNSCSSQFTTTTSDDVEITNCSQNTSNSSNSSHKNLFSDNISEIHEKSPALSSVKEENCVCGQNSTVMIMEQIEESENNVKQNNGSYIKKTNSEKDNRSFKSQNLKVANRLPFYYDEEAIEKVEGNTIATKDKIRKSINKCKARKTVSHKKKNINSESTAVKSNLILPDNISKLGKNSFLVTAEVHPPPNSIYPLEIKNQIDVSEKSEPHVLLIDLFKSNQGLLSEMVGNDLRESKCLQKTIAKSAVVPLSEKNITCAIKKNSNNMNDLNADNMDCENTENRCLPEDVEIIEHGKHQRRSKIVSYKEPSLIVKMRRVI